MTELLRDEFIVLFVLIIIWSALELFGGGGGGNQRNRNARADASSSARFYAAVSAIPLPPATFFVVWYVLNPFIGAATFGYLRDGSNGSTLYTSTLVLFIVNWLLNKLWLPVFFGGQSPVGGLVVVVLTLLETIVLLVLVVCDIGFTWVALVLLVYALWLATATLLNIIVLRRYNAAKTRIDAGGDESAVMASGDDDDDVDAPSTQQASQSLFSYTSRRRAPSARFA